MPDTPLLNPDALDALGHQITLALIVPHALWSAWCTACLDHGHDPAEALGHIVGRVILDGMQDVQTALAEGKEPFGDESDDGD
jgi:hypothetical protein